MQLWLVWYNLISGCYGQILESMGYVAVLVNNAGYFDESNFKKMIDVNLVRYVSYTGQIPTDLDRY